MGLLISHGNIIIPLDFLNFLLEIVTFHWIFFNPIRNKWFHVLKLPLEFNFSMGDCHILMGFQIFWWENLISHGILYLCS